MNNEKYNQIIDEAYENYRLKSNDIDLPENLYNNLIDDLNKDAMFPIDNPSRMLSKEKFINKIKTDSEFSEKWGLKIEERELSKSELNILYNIRRGVGKVDTNYSIGTVKSKDPSIPTKLITITYNNETIESYEN